jgi:hypothetical protein
MFFRARERTKTVLVSVTRFVEKDIASKPANIDNLHPRVLVTPQKIKKPKKNFILAKNQPYNSEIGLEISFTI